MSAQQPVVQLRGVGKRYGQRWALKDADLALQAGEILGFIGPNGAGKTTLMKIMAGLSLPTEGTADVLGERIGEGGIRTPEGIGLVLEQTGFIPYLSGRNNLRQLAAIRRVAGEGEITTALETVRLDPEDRRPVRAYSLGMRQRLALAQALMEGPRLLLLDEPTNGLDPRGIAELRELLPRLAERGIAIFVASHLLTEVERVCDRVLLVRDGRILRELEPAREGEADGLLVVVSSEGDVPAVEGWARRVGGTVERAPGVGPRPALRLRAGGYGAPHVIRELVGLGVDLEEVAPARRSLEQEYMELIAAGMAG